MSWCGHVVRSLLLVAPGIAGFGQQIQAPVQGPLLGYVLDETALRMRPLWGSPGAATFGDPVGSADIVSAVVSPKQDYALAQTDSTGAVSLVKTADGSLTKIKGLRTGVSQIALSADGSAAALYFAADQVVQVVSGLPGTPGAPVDVFLPSLRNTLQNLAVTDDGSAILYSDASAEVTVVAADGSRRNVLMLPGALSAAVFLRQSSDAVLASETEVSLVRDAVDSAVKSVLSTKGVPAPSKAAVAFDGSRIAFANTASGVISVLSLKAAGAPLTVDCQCSPTGIARVNGSSAFRLSGYSGSPLPLLDASAATPRVVVVPPPAVSQ